MSDASREHILQRVLADAASSDLQRKPGKDSNADLDQIIAGLVFAQRPIRDAAQVIQERYDLGPRGSFILSLIDKGVLYPLELATVLRIGKSLVTAELNRLISAGLVNAAPGQPDRRRSQLSLTPAGKNAAAAFRETMHAVLKRSLEQYSAKELRLFARMLGDVRRTGN